MELLNYSKKIYFLGIGGIGMSALARYFLLQGKEVYGYDLTATPITEELERAGAQIHFEENISLIPDMVDFVVHTPAISSKNIEYQYFTENHIPILKRSEVLGLLTGKYPAIAVAGTHGKTTTTAMIAQMLHGTAPIMAFIGGIAKNFNANFIIDDNCQYAVIEADEFDRSFLTLSPSVAVITSLDADHLDIYGDREHLLESFNLFADKISVNKGTLVIHESIVNEIRFPNKIIYGESNSCDYAISQVNMNFQSASFVIRHQDVDYPVTLGVAGMHNILNATAAFAAVRAQLGLDSTLTAKFVEKLSQFNGVKRRMDYQIMRPDLVYIDDYAHHPEEIKAILTALKTIYPDKKITGVFQPHLFTRTRDFAPDFAAALALLDEVILLDIYPAREMPIDGINATYLLNLIDKPNKRLETKQNLLPYLQQAKPELLITLGAGDIDQLVPILKEGL